MGKTTIAREFAEDVTRAAPMGLQKIVWLSAKQQFYAAILDKFVPASRVDFSDLQTLLKALLQELGHPESSIEADATRESLMDLTIESLQSFPSLVVIDDVDSLEPHHQSDVFQTVVQIVNRTTVGAAPSSRVLLTARLDLGAAPGQLIRVAGWGFEEFCERALKMAIRHRKNSLFSKTTQGAWVGEVCLSLIPTALLDQIDPFEYLTALLKEGPQLAQNPAQWLPWNFRQTLQASDTS